MPAETNRHRDPVDAPIVLDLIWALVSGPEDPEEPDPHTSLRQFDLDDELAVLQIWDAATEEFAERTLAEPDLSDLLAATTVGALAEAIVRSLRSEDHHT